MVKVYVGNIPEDVNSEDLRKLFGPYGKVSQCDVLDGRGYGFVHIEHLHDAEKAIKSLHGFTWKGSKLAVEISKGPRNHSNNPDVRGGRIGSGSFKSPSKGGGRGFESSARNGIIGSRDGGGGGVTKDRNSFGGKFSRDQGTGGSSGRIHHAEPSLVGGLGGGDPKRRRRDSPGARMLPDSSTSSHRRVRQSSFDAVRRVSPPVRGRPELGRRDAPEFIVPKSRRRSVSRGRRRSLSQPRPLLRGFDGQTRGMGGRGDAMPPSDAMMNPHQDQQVIRVERLVPAAAGTGLPTMGGIMGGGGAGGDPSYERELLALRDPVYRERLLREYERLLRIDAYERSRMILAIGRGDERLHLAPLAAPTTFIESRAAPPHQSTSLIMNSVPSSNNHSQQFSMNPSGGGRGGVMMGGGTRRRSRSPVRGAGESFRDGGSSSVHLRLGTTTFGSGLAPGGGGVFDRGGVAGGRRERSPIQSRHRENHAGKFDSSRSRREGRRRSRSR